MKLFVVILMLSPTLVATPVTSLLPQPDFEPGWVYDFVPEIYTPDNLHIYINGEAELYRRYDVQKMATASYVNKSTPHLTFSVDIYDMANALNAFGIYSYYRHPDMNFTDIGEQAVISDVSVRFWKGRYFVKLVGGALDTTLTATLRQTAQRIADEIPSLEKPKQLDTLPREDQVVNSLKYLKTDYPNAKNTELLEAQYESNGDRAIAFIIFAKNKAQTGEILSHITHHTIIKQIGNTICGIKDFTTHDFAATLLDKF